MKGAIKKLGNTHTKMRGVIRKLGDHTKGEHIEKQGETHRIMKGIH